MKINDTKNIKSLECFFARFKALQANFRCTCTATTEEVDIQVSREGYFISFMPMIKKKIFLEIRKLCTTAQLITLVYLLTILIELFVFLLFFAHKKSDSAVVLPFSDVSKTGTKTCIYRPPMAPIGARHQAAYSLYGYTFHDVRVNACIWAAEGQKWSHMNSD